MQPQNQIPENDPQPNEAPQPSATPPPPTFGDDRARPPVTPPGTTESGVVAPDSELSQSAYDSSQTYPNSAPVVTSAGSQSPISDGPRLPDSSVSARVAAVRLYAWAVISYAVISLAISLIGMVGLMRDEAGLALVMLGPWLLMGVLFGPGLQVLIGVYLLFAKSLRNVSIVLTILLVLGILGFLGPLVALFNGEVQPGLWDVASVAMSLILLVLLWQARTKVEAERKPRQP